MSVPRDAATLTGMRKRLYAIAAVIGAGLLAVPAVTHAAQMTSTDPYFAPAGMTAEEVTFSNGDTRLYGTVVKRADLDSQRRHPAIVLVHGSGPSKRVHLSQEAEVFAKAGMVTLIYDKRSSYSKTNRDFSALADDALAGVKLLGERGDVEPAAVGMWGLSEGGWVAPLAASQSDRVKFLITIGASGLSTPRTQAWNLSNRLANAGVSPSTVDAIAGAGMSMAVGLGQFPAADYDPVPALRAIKQPVLAIWGEKDVQVPPRESAEIFRSSLVSSPSVTIRVLPSGDHAGRVTTNGYDRVGGPVIDGVKFGELHAAYPVMMTEWIADVIDDRPPAPRADQLPVQRHDSVPVRAAWPGFVLLGLIVLGLLSWPVWRKGWAPRLLVLTGLSSVVGATAYVIWAVAHQAKGVSELAFGQPLPWMVLRGLTVTALVCAGIVVAAWFKQRSMRLGTLAAAGVLLIPFALGSGLLLP
jgi:pimeloyl-ACP methyl ester carboxylesterase